MTIDPLKEHAADIDQFIALFTVVKTELEASRRRLAEVQSEKSSCLTEIQRLKDIIGSLGIQDIDQYESDLEERRKWRNPNC